MKRWLIISAVALGVIVLTVVLGITFGSDYIANQYVLPRVARRLGTELTWGSVRTSFGEVVLEDLTLALPNVSEVETSTRSLRVVYSIWPLISGRLEVREIVFDSPRLAFARLDHDVLSRFQEQISLLAQRGEASLASGGGSSSGFEVRMINGEVLAGLASGSGLHLEGIDGRLGAQGRFGGSVRAARILGDTRSNEIASAGPVLISGRRERGRILNINETSVEGLSARWVFGGPPSELELVLRELRELASGRTPADSANETTAVGGSNLQIPDAGLQPDAGERASTDAGPLEEDSDVDAPPPDAASPAEQIEVEQPSVGSPANMVRLPTAVSIESGLIELVWIRSEESSLAVEFTDLEGEVFLGSESEPPFFRMTGETRPGSGRFDVSGSIEGGAPRIRLQVRSLRIAQLTRDLSIENAQFDESSLLDGDVTVSLEPGRVVIFRGEIGTDGLALRSSLISPEPLSDLRVRTVARGRLTWPTRTLELEEARLFINGVETRFTGGASRTAEYTSLDVSMELFTVPCIDLLRATPEPLRDRLDDLDLEGSISGRVRVAIDTRRLGDTALEVNLRNNCRATGRGPLAISRLHAAFWHRVALPEDEVFEFRTGPGAGAWASLEQISPYMISSVLTTEDGGFFHHNGFSLREIRNALVRDVAAGGPRFGASTISMQLARNLYLYRGRTLARKLQEAVLTWYLEEHLSKEEILAIYLNIIEFGPEIFGVRSAALHYFGRQPDDLSPREAMFLAKLLPAPVPRHEETYEEGELSPRWEARLDRALRRMRERRSLTREEARVALAERISFHRAGDPYPPHRTWRRSTDIPRGEPEEDPTPRRRRGEAGEAYIPPPPELVDDSDDW